MENKPLHWTDLASCVGDDRFTGTYEALSPADVGNMAVMCLNCPVQLECLAWAEREQATDVWACAMWRFPSGEAVQHDD